MQRGIRILYPTLLTALLWLSPAAYAATQTSDAAAETKTEVGMETKTDTIVPEIVPGEAANGDFGGLLGSWTLVTLDGTMPETDRGALTLEVMPDGTVAGFSGVNRYRTKMTTGLPPGHVKFKQAASTMMAGPEDVMATEQIFMQRLGAVSTFTITGDTLRMYAGDNEALTFTRSTTPTSP